MKGDKLIVKGNIAFSVSPEVIEYHPNSFIVLNNGSVEAIIAQLPQDTSGFRLLDYGDSLIIPGFSDLHVHASQIYQRGIGMDAELIEWLSKYTFQQEKAFSDEQHAKEAYKHFADELVSCGTLHASIFATVHKTATRILFETLIDRGIPAYVGKVNMNRNTIPELTEVTASSLSETEELITDYIGNPLVKPIITPRFVPTCTADLLEKLGELAAKYDVPVQSHLSENRDEVKWVRMLHPDIDTYSGVYDRYGLFGKTETLMAHCIYLQDKEVDLILQNGVIAVHCPDSNMNLTSGIMPVRKLIKKGVMVGLGSDVGGGHNLSIAKAIVRAIQSSKILRMQEPEAEALTFEETFHMATKGNGSFFGRVGSFEPGYDFDALVIDDSTLGERGFSLAERLQRFIYIGDDRNIAFRYVKGNLIA